jgi:hypothetical protein
MTGTSPAMTEEIEDGGLKGSEADDKLLPSLMVIPDGLGRSGSWQDSMNLPAVVPAATGDHNGRRGQDEQCRADGSRIFAVLRPGWRLEGYRCTPSIEVSPPSMGSTVPVM